MNRLSVEQFKEADKLPLVVVLDDVRSMYNVGSVFRTGDAFRIEAVYMCGIQFHPESVLTPEGKTIIKNWLAFDGEDFDKSWA